MFNDLKGSVKIQDAQKWMIFKNTKIDLSGRFKI